MKNTNHSQYSKITGNTFIGIFLIIFIATAFTIAPKGYSMTCVNGEPNCELGNIDCDTRLVEERPGEGYHKIPLIFIHGIHGNYNESAGEDNVCNPDKYYFSHLMNYLEKNLFNHQYKIYRFHYVSDKYDVSEIGESLGAKINSTIQCYKTEGCSEECKLKDVPIVLIAHSMGGLVARSYMQNWGGERVLKLLTLATPHHGSPGANDEGALEYLHPNELWDHVFMVSQLLYNLSISYQYKNWSVTFHSDEPNRSDLRWDNMLEPLLFLMKIFG